MSGINRNYLKELLSSEVVVYKNDLPDFNIRDSGLYVLHPIFICVFFPVLFKNIINRV